MNLTQKQVKLDEWDYKLIKACKSHVSSSNPLTENTFKEIWAERCDLDIKHVDIKIVCEHLLELAQNLGLFDNNYTFNNFIFDLNKDNNWKFICSGRDYIKNDTKDFNLILLSRLDSLFSLTKVVMLPGYKEFVNKG